jgi:hypothetical protein
LTEDITRNLFSENFKAIASKDIILAISAFLCLKSKKLNDPTSLDFLLSKEAFVNYFFSMESYINSIDFLGSL